MTETNTVEVNVKLFANFRQDRFKEARRVYPSGTTIADIIADLGIGMEEIGMIFLHGRHAEPDHVLKDGDVLALFPLLGGG